MKLFGSSGIRTLYDRNLLDTAFRVGLAVGKIHQNVIVGRDTRTSGDAMKHAVMAGLLAAGAQCSDAGITPTPTLAFATRGFNAGVMITASHNPPEYNGLKLLNPDGSSFDTPQQAEIENIMAAESFTLAGWEEVKPGEAYAGAVENHIEAILADFPSALHIKVVVDAGCGAAAGVTPRLLERLGCEVVALNCYNSGFFPRGIEPNEENLPELCLKVKENGAAVGIAHDGDADRMMAVDERGRFISGDKLLAILIKAAGAKDVVTTLDASMAVDEMGVKIRRTKIGDTWVSEELRKGGDFGGETAGAWIFPSISLCPDGIYAAAQIAALAAKSSLAEMADAVPAYPLLRGSLGSKGVSLPRLEAELMKLQPLRTSKIDGLKLDFADGWLLVRPSGTEPRMRLTAEAKTEAAVKQLYDKAVQAVNNSVENGVKAI
ncbi:MAG: phosphoglucosamine mutase [Dehalococcoidales bacterium]|jgi:phosphoglucosamine mutase